MKSPYISKNCGHSFEKDMIEEWLYSHNKCPICKKEMIIEDLRVNFELKNIMEATFKKIEE